jgi:hypothetical protein
VAEHVQARNAADIQQEFWIETRRLPQASASTFNRKRDETLYAIGFTAGGREICRPAYALRRVRSLSSALFQPRLHIRETIPDDLVGDDGDARKVIERR